MGITAILVVVVLWLVSLILRSANGHGTTMPSNKIEAMRKHGSFKTHEQEVLEEAEKEYDEWRASRL